MRLFWLCHSHNQLIDGDTRGLGFFYNQTEDLSWPKRGDGEVRADWDRDIELPCFYGKVLTTGGAQRGRASGVPFAVVGANGYFPQHEEPVPYRYEVNGFQGPCPLAA